MRLVIPASAARRYSRLSASPVSATGGSSSSSGRQSAGLGPTYYLVAAVFLVALSLSYINRDEVVELTASVADSARGRYSSIKLELGEVAEQGYHRYWQPQATATAGAEASGLASTASSAHVGSVIDLMPENVDDGLEPEWHWARTVSIVYTWVNGSDPAYQELRKKHGGTVGSERDRDNDDLRFSLRALEAMLPWHKGTVCLVSPKGHIPHWLNDSNPRFQYIDQDTLLPPGDVPTFNSNLIEAYFHLIPNLTERFIVLNDDYLMANPIHPEAFFTKNGGVKMFLEPWHMGVAADRQGDRQWEKSLRYTAGAIEKHYGEIYHEKPRITEHAPFVFYKQAYEGLHHAFNSAIRKNGQHKFRHPQDVIIPFLHNAYVIQEGSRCCGLRYETLSGHSPFFQWTLDPQINEERWDRTVGDPRWNWFNVNDAMGDDANPVLLKKAQDALRRKLEEKYPVRSSFELPPADGEAQARSDPSSTPSAAATNTVPQGRKARIIAEHAAGKRAVPFGR